MIFLDSGYLIGLLDKKDSHHRQALKIEKYLNNLNELTVINTTVIVETLNRSVGTRDIIKNLWDDLHINNKVVQLTDEDYANSLKINSWFDNAINYSDCTILNTMFDKKINKIVSFDSDFRKIHSLDVISKI